MFNQKLKFIKIRLLAIVLLFVGAMVSCKQESKSNVGSDQLANQSGVVRLTGARAKLQDIMSLGVRKRSSAGASQNGRSEGKKLRSRFSQSRSENDSTDWGDGDDWGYETCAKITEIINTDSSVTYIEDYGIDGCEEYGVLVKGKITETISYIDRVERIETIYEAFSYDGVTIDGTSSAQYIWDESWGENETDSMDYDYSYSSSWKEDLTTTFEKGEVYTIKADFSEEYADDKLVMTGSYEGSESNGDTFSFMISSPLIHDFSCEEAFVPVQGVEEGAYNDERFSIDYGNGACDNLATITENGESYEIDFGAEWEEECGGHDNDNNKG